jgi:hypothetical protein
MVQQTWRSMSLAMVVAILLALAAACGPAEPVPTLAPAEVESTSEAAVDEFVAAYPLAATAWDLDYFGPPEEPEPLLPDTRATVLYFWDRYAGFDGCNWLLGTYTAAAAGELRMQTPSRTLNICAPPELYDQSLQRLVPERHRIPAGGDAARRTVNDQRLLT